jgi:hypothetical protein
LPCTVETICRYIAFLARSLSYSSIPGYLNIIRLLHVESGLDNPLSPYRIKSFLKGVNRRIRRPPKQKLPITVEILKQMYNVLDYLFLQGILGCVHDCLFHVSTKRFINTKRCKIF